MSGLHVKSNASGVAAVLAGMAKNVGPKVNAHVSHWGLMLLARVKANAAGRPGPRQVTGDLNRSITLSTTKGSAPSALVGTNRPQAPRLEFGFVGVDSIGRHYRQPPYPFMNPALDAIQPEFEAATFALIADLFGG